MVTNFWTRTTILLVSIVARQCSGAHGPKKIQILVPHNIHHHTHTKYTFIPVPVPAVRTANRTDAPPTAWPSVVLPVMPVVPITPTNITPTVQPQLAPGQFQPIQPGFMQPQTPAQPPQPAPPAQQQPPNRYIHHNNYDHDHEYDYDLVGRSSRNKITRADPPQPTHSAPMPPIKFKTVINVQETQKIPIPPLPTLMEIKQLINEQAKKKIQFPKLLDFPKLFKADPPQRIKVDVYPQKDLQLQQIEKILAQWKELQEAVRAQPYTGYKPQDFEFDSETAAYKLPPETVAEKPEWAALKHLLEKQIHSDFPGLKVDAEIKPINYQERALSSDAMAASSGDHPDLRHVGYIVIGDNNQKHFVNVDGTVTTTKT